MYVRHTVGIFTVRSCCHTVLQVAKVMGLSKQRVGQLVKAALQRLRVRVHQLRSADGEWGSVLDTLAPAM